MKFITPLSKAEEKMLREAYCNHPNANVRERAFALLLNNRGYRVVRLGELFEVRHETAGSWLKKGLIGLYDLHHDQNILKFLKQCDDEGKLNLYHFDESGFSTIPTLHHSCLKTLNSSQPIERI